MLIVKTVHWYWMLTKWEIQYIRKRNKSCSIFRFRKSVSIDNNRLERRSLKFDRKKLIPLFYKNHRLPVIVVRTIKKDLSRTEVLFRKWMNIEFGNIRTVFISNIINSNLFDPGHHNIKKTIVDLNLSDICKLTFVILNFYCTVKWWTYCSLLILENQLSH